MRSIFSPEGAVALRRAVETQALLVFDFDGTLAPIVDDPADAFTPAATAGLLLHLLGHFKIAVVSGRSTDDLAPRLGFSPTIVVGNHGAEGLGDAPLPEHLGAAAWLKARLAAHQPELDAAGVTLEDKQLSWTLHYRQAPDHARARQAIQRTIEPLDERLHAFGGKCCVNLVLAGASTKGHAVEALVAEAGATGVLFMGDDVTDESVYRMSRPSWLTIHVGRTEHVTGASFYVDTQRDVAGVLRRLVDLTHTLGR